MGGRRSPAGQHAERINAAADLAEAGVLPAEAARLLAGRFAVSERQARRYVDQAAAGGRVPVPEATVVFTVKLLKHGELSILGPPSRQRSWYR